MESKGINRALTPLLVLGDLIVIVVSVVVFIFYLIHTRGFTQEAKNTENQVRVHAGGLCGASGALTPRIKVTSQAPHTDPAAAGRSL